MIRAGLCALVGAVAMSATAPHAALRAQEAQPRRDTAELTSKAWLYEVMRHLYRWHIDEEHIDAVVRSGTVTFWARETAHALDPGDRSAFGEVLLPQVGMLVKVKRADYSVPELDLTVKSERFKITHVGLVSVPEAMPEGFTEVVADYQHMRDELFRTRGHASFPEGAMLEHMRAAARTAILKEAERAKAEPPKGVQVVHLAPLSPIANEAWAFWESGRTLIRFASDADLANPGVWDHHDLVVDVYPLDRNVVVSLDEVAGSNAYMTRDQAGRALFNCMILGKRLELEPPQAAPAPAPTP